VIAEVAWRADSDWRERVVGVDCGDVEGVAILIPFPRKIGSGSRQATRTCCVGCRVWPCAHVSGAVLDVARRQTARNRQPLPF
jgi:hypothetical protein